MESQYVSPLLRGNVVREQHSSFLYHAIKNGLEDRQCEMIEVYENIPGRSLKAVEDVLLNTDPLPRIVY